MEKNSSLIRLPSYFRSWKTNIQRAVAFFFNRKLLRRLRIYRRWSSSYFTTKWSCKCYPNIALKLYSHCFFVYHIPIASNEYDKLFLDRIVQWRLSQLIYAPNFFRKWLFFHARKRLSTVDVFFPHFIGILLIVINFYHSHI